MVARVIPLVPRKQNDDPKFLRIYISLWETGNIISPLVAHANKEYAERDLAYFLKQHYLRMIETCEKSCGCGFPVCVSEREEGTSAHAEFLEQFQREFYGQAIETWNAFWDSHYEEEGYPDDSSDDFRVEIRAHEVSRA